MAKKESRRGHKRGTSNQSKVIQNRRARHDYELGDSIVAGVVLTGAETKSLRMGHGNLTGAYITVKDGELFMLGGTIHGTSGVPIDDQAKNRTRKLLAKRREIEALIAAKQQGKTIVPLEILTRGRYIKIRIAIGKGKKHYDKRSSIKERDAARETARTVRP